MRYVEKYGRARQATDDNMAHALCILKNYVYKYTPRRCNTCYFTTAKVVAGKCLKAALHAPCLSFCI